MYRLSPRTLLSVFSDVLIQDSSAWGARFISELKLKKKKGPAGKIFLKIDNFPVVLRFFPFSAILSSYSEISGGCEVVAASPLFASVL